MIAEYSQAAIAADEAHRQHVGNESAKVYETHTLGESSTPLWGDLTAAGARAIWRALSAQLGIAHFTSHAIRHTCATELLAAGVPEIVIAEHLGHHGLGTIRNYAKVLDLQRQQAVDVMQNLVRPIELKEAS